MSPNTCSQQQQAVKNERQDCDGPGKSVGKIPQSRDGREDLQGAVSRDGVFFSTSDLMNRMNATIQQQQQQNDNSQDRFELQRRMPDGSTRRADEADVAAADFQSKLKQAAAMIVGLTFCQKLTWANEMRRHGNGLFQRQRYKEATDVYLTCLVAMNPDPSTDDPTGNLQSSETAGGRKAVLEKEIQLPVLLNLTLCALHLGMLKKAEQFCTFALDLDIGKTNSKVYFRRGRARMLMGEYDAAKTDLEMSKSLLLNETTVGNDKDDDATTLIRKEKEFVTKELQKLDKLVKTARDNKAKQKEALRLAMGIKNDNEGAKKTCNNAANNGFGENDRQCGTTRQQHSPIVADGSSKRRSYSQLRSPCSTTIDDVVRSDFIQNQIVGKDETHDVWSCVRIIEHCIRTAITLCFNGKAKLS